MVKQCLKCGTSDRHSNGRCKECKKRYNAIWQAEHLELARSKYKANAKTRAVTIKKWQSANAERVKANGAAYREANREKCRIASAKSAAKRTVEKAAYRKAWFAANKERSYLSNRAWADANKDLKRVYGQNRRAKIFAGGLLSKGIRQQLFASQNGLCACCGIPLGAGYHLDHIMPLALGGTNTDDNVQLLRATCNQHKSDLHPDEYARRKKMW